MIPSWHVLLLPLFFGLAEQAVVSHTGCPTTGFSPPSIPENLPAGTELFDFTNIHGITLTGPESSHFNVSDKGGHNYGITSQTPFDFEKLQHRDNPVALVYVPFSCTLMTGQVVTGSLPFAVTNVIESSPVFGRSNVHFVIPENYAINSEVGTLQVTIADGYDNAFVSFELNPKGTPFKVDWPPNNTPNRYHTAVISVQSPLNYEQTTQYTLELKATVRDTNKTSTVTVYINVTDVDDLPPKFDQSNGYTVTVAEAVFSQKSIIQLRARDKDAGQKPIIQYSLIRVFPSTSLFRVDNTTGQVFINGDVDREKCDSYLLLIKAYQKDKPDLRMDVTTLKVVVSDEDDNPPVMTQTKYTARIPENTPQGVHVLTVTATDADQGVNAEFHYKIEHQGNSDAFTIDQSSGLISVNNGSVLDRETTPTWRFTVFAESTQNRSIRSNEAHITVNLLDENDNSPVFNRSNYTFVVNKTLSIPGDIGTIRASDIDESNNGRVVYRLEGDESKRFNISTVGNSGKLQALLALDSDYKPWYRFTVIASDMAPIGYRRQTSAQVDVRVIDVNVNKPVFVNMTTNISVQEDIDIDRDVLLLQAYDKDTSDDLTFMLENVSDFKLKRVDNRSTMIVTNKALDRESRPHGYNLTVKVTDSLHTSTTTLAVKIEDINDNAPEFQPSWYTFNVTEGVTPKIVGNVSATDKDLDKNGLVRYSILSPWNGNFSIAKTGQISVTSGLDREVLTSTSGQLTLLVMAADNGTPSLTSTAQVTVHVEDTNDHAPLFKEKVKNIDTDEGKTFSFKLQAYDEDIGANGHVLYRIGHTNTTLMEVTNGLLRSKAALTYGVYEVEVIAYNSVPYSIQGLTNDALIVYIHVKDINNHSPQFKNTPYRFSLREDFDVGQLMNYSNIRAEDKDETREYNTVTYSVVNGDGYFEINPQNAALRLIKPLDYENKRQITFKIKASDGDMKHEVEVNVSVTVQDVNDNAPVFSSELYNCTVNENVTSVINCPVPVNASDHDEGENGQIHYTIDGYTKDIFTINTTTGEIHPRFPLDYDIGARTYILTILAIDKGSPSMMTGSTIVEVTVKDRNDNPPLMHGPSKISILENEPVNTSVATIYATDVDSKSMLSFSLSESAQLRTTKEPNTQRLGGPNATFILSKRNGPPSMNTASIDIVLNKELDREANPHGYNLTLSVTDIVHTSTVTVSVHIEDVNDNAPIFQPSSYNFTVDEELSPKVIGNIKATDQDLFKNSKLHYSVLPPWGSNFHITESGQVNVTSSLDRETLSASFNQITAVVMATDGGTPPLIATAVVTIEVRDVNDHAPRFMDNVTSIIMNEGEKLSFPMKAYDEDEGTNARIYYVIGKTNATAVEVPNGILMSKAALTYGVYEVEVIAYNSVSYSIQGLTNDTLIVYIHVKDVNDHSPQFKNTPYKLTLREDFEVGHLVNQSNIHAEDKDETSEYNTVTYSVVNGDGYFEINPQNAALRLIKPLDYEGKRQITFKVIASDGNITHQVGVNVSVTVLDVNDNAPVFTSELYNCTVDENVTSSISCPVRVSASDIDAGENGHIHYTIEGYTKDIFTINGTTGDIHPRFPLDYDIGERTYILTILATDSGSPHMTGSAMVEVTVKNKNDNSPVIHGPSNITIPENVPLQTSVATMFATDVDMTDVLSFSLSETGLPSQIVSPPPVITTILNTQIQGVNDNSTFILSAKYGLHTTDASSVDIVINKALDRETNPHGYNLTLTVTDTVHTSTVTVSVNIEDVNDNAPVFQPSSYNFTVDEELSPKVIGVVKATDKDQSENGILQYKVLPPWGSHFHITQSGQINVTSALDRETVSATSNQITLLIMATDTGTPPRQATATVTVDVEDVNDNAPTFVDNLTTISMNEGQNLSFPIKAYDEDEGANARINYDIEYTNASSVEVTNGTLRSKAALKYGVYEVEVIAYNNEPYCIQGLTNDTLIVYIHVKDINDHKPKFDNTSYRFSIREDFEVGQLLNQSNIHAEDKDETREYNTVTYSVVSGDGYFEINPQNAALRLIKQLDYEDKRRIMFQVIASDGDITHQVKVNVSVTVLDVNDNAPMFSSGLYNCTVAENGSLPLNCSELIRASDNDTGNNGLLHYKIAEYTKDIFTINSMTGEIQPNSPLDYDTGARIYILMILAIDNGNPKKTGSAVIEVTVKDINDNPPVIHGPSQFNIPENLPINTSVGTVFATDADITSVLRFSLTSNTDFHIQQDTGLLFTTRMFDYEKASDRYAKVNVTVSDSTHTTVFPISVAVTNVNDEIPVFVNSSLSQVISEDTGDQSFYIQATDGDTGSSLSYNISYSPNIRIAKHSGLVTIEGPVNSRDNGTITFNVSVSDGKHIKTDTVTVRVFDVNDNAPMFENSTYTFEVKEELDDASVGHVTATDKDPRDLDKLRYSILPPWNGNFNITKNGVIRVTSALDRENLTETSGQITLLVKAEDTGKPPLMSIATVTVHVQDVNDHAPCFIDTVKSINTDEGRNVSFPVEAYDEDDGRYGTIYYSIKYTNFSSLEITTDGTLVSTDTLTYGVYKVEIIAYNAEPYTVQGLTNGTLTVYMNVEDINNHRPIFNKTLYKLSLPEDFPVGHLVNESNIHAEDKDETREYNTVTYSVVNGDGYFEINPQNAALRLIKPLDYEDKRHIMFKVIASDGDITHQVEVNVSVAVLDVNDNAPVFSSALYNCTVAENATSPLYCSELINASDNDTGGNNGHIRYTIEDQTDVIFKINRETGVIRPHSPLDYDTGVQTYVLTILAIDNGNPKKTGSAVVEVTVKDINDNPPVIHGPSQFTIPENLPINTSVGTVFATDADINDVLRFSLTNNADFYIQQNTGLLFTKQMFDYEKESDRYTSVNVTVRDGTHTAVFPISVAVTNVNDEIPVFVNTTLTPVILEDMVTPSFYVQATDGDIDSQLFYNISVGSGIDISSSSGLVTIESPINSRDNKTIEFGVSVSDGIHMETTTVTVRVIDVNDNAPRFANSTYTFDVDEELAHAFVGTVKAHDDDTDPINKYMFYMIPTLRSSNITINATSGDIRTTSGLDRENPSVTDDQIKVLVMVVDKGLPHLTGTTLVTININDVNDHSPTFVQSSVTYTILEGLCPSPLHNLTTIDEDEGNNKRTWFKITKGTNRFGINNSISVECKKPLDVGDYTITIQADNIEPYHGNPTKHVQTVVLHVKDVNNNDPVFDRSWYSLDLLENQTVGELYFTPGINATDADTSAEYNTVTYAIVQGNDSSFFDINPYNGQLWLKKPLDYEREKLLTLEVSASDGKVNVNDGKRHMTTAAVLITIDNINDNAPTFTSGLTRCSVLENVTGEFNCSVSATDGDAGDTARLTYTLMAQSEIFDVDSQSGVITVRNSTFLDFEGGIRHFDLELLSVDGDTPQLTGSTIVSIEVENANDEYPVFPNTTYVFEVPEGEQEGYFIGQVSATDQDYDIFSKLTYSLKTSKEIHINDRSGDIFTSAVLDYDNPSQIRVITDRVVAWDGANSVTATVTISVLNVNDNTPQFTNTTYRTYIQENTASGQLLTQVHAIDKDNLNSLQYTIVGGDDACGTFDINSTSGQISVNTKSCLDYERQKEYTLVIEVNDGGTPPRTNETIVQVIVIDEDDVAPTFIMDSLVGFVKENSPIKTSILKIYVVDPDTPIENVTVTVNNSKFVFDNWTLYTNSLLDAEDVNIYSLEIFVSDGVNSHTRSQLITVNVTDINDNTPAFNKTIYTRVIPQNAKAGSFVLTIGAMDADISNSGFTFFLSGGEGKFVIDDQTGIVSIATNHVYLCVNCTYNMEVHVVDYGAPPKSNSTQMSICIDTSNHNAPVFSEKLYKVNVSEHQMFPHIIINVSATDADCPYTTITDLCGPAGSVVYSIVSGSQGLFTINQSTGFVYVNGTLDFKKASSYDLVVEARDMAEDFKSASAEVVVNVIDINERPHFVKNVTSVCSVEDVEAGVLVGIVTASDPDDNSPYLYNKLKYTLLNDNDKFRVNATTGKIYALHNITASSIQTVVLQFLVTDHGGLNDTTTLRLSTGTKGKPVFEKDSSFIHVRIQENTLVPVDIADVNTTTEHAGTISYHLVPYVEGFHINNSTGVIEATEILDHETSPNVILTVTATNSEGVCSSLVDIDVLDVNDQPPVFRYQHTTVSVLESTPVGTCIQNVLATDKDSKPQLTFEILNDITSFGIEDRNDSLSACVINTSPLDFENITHYNLTIQVSDGIFNNTKTLEVVILDFNDNFPIFSNRTYQTAISEETAVGSSFYQLSASDADHLDDGKLQYTLVNDSNDVFSIKSDKGLGYVILNKQLDREINASYSLEISVTDTANHTTSTVLDITVLDVNDNKPKFLEEVYNETVDEGPKSEIFTVDTEASDIDEGHNADLVYSIISQDFGRHFSINSTTGVIDVLTSLNREDTPMYTLVIQAADKGDTSLSGTATVFINVDDINDCAPEFLQTTYSATVMEGSPSGTSVIHLTATDMDALPTNRNVSYSIMDYSDLFGVDEDGVLTLKQKVVVGTHPSPYVVQVEATDGKYSTTVNITVTVIDVNDHDPVFNETLYSFSVPENDEFVDPPSVLVGIVSATDDDPGSEITYHIMSTDVPVFIISPMNGSITTNGTLDRDQCVNSRYTFTVIATDNGNATRTGFVEVTVTISDVNDNSPEFTSVEYDGNVIENSPVGTEVNVHPAILASDIDAGDNGTDGIVFYLSTDFPFEINNKTGRVFVKNATLDRETQDTYSLTVWAIDQLGSGRNMSTFLIITLDDANDEPPVFTHNVSIFTFNESVPNSYLVGTVNTSDSDVDGNETTRYIIDSGGEGRFYIDQIQGGIKVTGGLDREQKANYTLIIRASDGRNSALAEVEIILEDTNDNAPAFPSNPVVISVTESNTSLPGIYKFTAYDPDLGENSRLSYFINRNDSDYSIFAVSEDGILNTSTALDRETNATYTFTVYVRDHGTPSLSSSVKVICHVQDANDNFPIFYDSQNKPITEYRTSILEKSPISSPVFFPYVKDNDLGKNSLVHYQLVGIESDLFQCNYNTGVVTIAKRIEINSLIGDGKGYNSTTEYVDIVLVVEATDEGDPSKSTNMTLLVTVEQISDENPVFDETMYDFYVPESMDNGSYVGVVTALMPNVTNYYLTYSFVIPNHKVVLDKTSGNITLNSTLDREESESYTFAVQVTDGKTPERTAFTMVNIHVTDVNDNAPQFQFLPYVLTVTEGRDVILDIKVISATDKDAGQNSVITYHLLNYTGDIFGVNKTTGNLMIHGTLDRETNQNFNLIVQAEDSGSPPLNATTDVRVEIKDINDNSPQFQRTNYTCCVLENASYQQICNVSATDDDAGDNGTVVYSLQEKNIPFYINPTDGTIWKSGMTDFETISTYNLTLVAHDLGSPMRSSSVSLIIFIDDVPDTAPHFTSRLYNVYTSPFTPVHSVILNMTAGDHGITYTIPDGPPDVLETFCIDKSSGIISLCKAMDSKKSNYVLTIIAEDDNLTDTAVVVVNIRNEPASFQQNHFTADIQENHKGLLLDLNTTEEIAGYHVHYTLISVLPEGTGAKFLVNETTGEIYCLKSLDREQAETYTLSVSAEVIRSSGRSRRSIADSLGQVTVTVRVGDENDNPPFFAVDIQHVYRIPVNLPLAGKVAELHAFDPDNTSTITYSLVNATELPFFLDNDIGSSIKILVKSSLKLGSYNLTVSATDEGGHSTDVHVTIITIPEADRLTYVIPMAPQEFEKQKQALIANLSSILGVNIMIEGYKAHISTEVEPDKTDLLLYATNRTTGHLLSNEKLSSIISAKFADIFKLFKCTEATCYVQSSTVKHSSNLMTAPEIALLTIAILIFVACLIVIIAGNHIWKQFHEAREQEVKMWELESLRSDVGSQFAVASISPNIETSFTALDDSGNTPGLATRNLQYESQELRMDFHNEAFVMEPPVTNGADSGVENDSSSSSNIDDNEPPGTEVIPDPSSTGKGVKPEQYKQVAPGPSSGGTERKLVIPSKPKSSVVNQQRVTLHIDMDTGDTDDGDLALNNDTSSVSSVEPHYEKIWDEAMVDAETSDQPVSLTNDTPLDTPETEINSVHSDTAHSRTSSICQNIGDIDLNVEEEMMTSF